MCRRKDEPIINCESILKIERSKSNINIFFNEMKREILLRTAPQKRRRLCWFERSATLRGFVYNNKSIWSCLWFVFHYSSLTSTASRLFSSGLDSRMVIQMASFSLSSCYLDSPRNLNIVCINRTRNNVTPDAIAKQFLYTLTSKRQFESVLLTKTDGVISS